MNKAELVEVVAGRIDASKKDAGEAVQAVVDAITEAVAKGQKVSISGFGVFEKVSRPARTYRTPSTGEAIRKVATAVPKFRPGGDFKALVSGEKSIAEQAVRAARGAGDAAESVVRKVTRKGGAAATDAPAEAAPVVEASAASAPPPAAKKTTARKAAPRKTAAAGTTGAAATARKAPAKRTTADGTTARKAPVKRTTAKKAAAPAPAEASTEAPPAAEGPATEGTAAQ